MSPSPAEAAGDAALDGSAVAEVDDRALLEAIETARRAQDDNRVRAIREAFEPTSS